MTIAPTRELARQIFNDFELLGAAGGLVVKCFYGGGLRGIGRCTIPACCFESEPVGFGSKKLSGDQFSDSCIVVHVCDIDRYALWFSM